MMKNYKKLFLIFPMLLLNACTASSQHKTWLENFMMGNINYKLYVVNEEPNKGVNDTSYYELYKVGNIKPITREVKEIKRKQNGKIIFSSIYKVFPKHISFSKGDDSLYHKYKVFTPNANGILKESRQDILKIQHGDTQNNYSSSVKDELFVDQLDVVAEYPGGINEARKFIAQNVIFPEDASDNDVQGSVYATFVIDRNGNVTDIKIEKGLGYGCDEEVVRVLKKMPKWKPAELRGKKVRSRMRMPVSFVTQ